MNKKISVIIPVYKVEKYLAKCLDSVISQTYRELEIILVDDGSPDGCGEICDEYASKDERIKVIHKENGGVARARNAGLDIASGDYIGFVDSDDWIEPDMYELLIKNAVKYGADMSMCGETVYDNGELIATSSSDEIVQLNRIEAKKYTVVGGRMGFIWNKIYSRHIIKDIRFSPEYGCSEDLMFVYQLLENTDKVVIDNRAKYNYFRNEGGITKGKFGYGAFGVVDVMRNMLECERNSEVYPYCVKGFTDAAFTVLSGVIVNETCEDRFEDLIAEILSYKKDVFFSGKHSRADKIKITILSVSPKLYRRVIKKVRKIQAR